MRRFACLLWLFWTPTRVLSQTTIADLLEQFPEVSQTLRILKKTGLDVELLRDNNKEYTFFAPVDTAVLGHPLVEAYMHGIDEEHASWRGHLRATMLNHIVANEGEPALSKDLIFDASRTKLISRQDPILVSQIETSLSPKDVKIILHDIQASNGVLHIIDGVLEPNFFNNTFSNLELQPEFGPDIVETPPRITLQTVTDFVDGRHVFDEMRESGTTQLGCRLRAFVDRSMGQDYLQQTINDSETVQHGEFLNETRKAETIDQFFKYSFLPYNFYADNIPNFYQELVDPVNTCGHMWISNTNGKLCFNDACVVDKENEPRREFLSSNGYGYVLDRCLVCPGFSMMARYTDDYTTWKSKTIADFLEASLWNRRDMTRNVGDPDQPITFFAPLDTYYEGAVKKDLDTVRLTTPKWLPHLHDLLSYYMVQGNFSADNLPTFPVQSIQGENLTVSDFQLTNIRGVDGLMHFVGETTAPLSLSDNVYDYLTKNPDLSIHNTWMDVVDLGDRLGTLLPITSMYVNNDGLEGQILPLSQTEDFLQSHMLPELYFCKDLVAKEGTIMKSMNNLTWAITVNEEGFPCFDTVAVFGSVTRKACITECDIPRRNGVVHLLDNMMVKTPLETLPPTPAPTTVTPTISPKPTLDETTSPTVAPTLTQSPVRDVTRPPTRGITNFIGGGDHSAFASSGSFARVSMASWVLSTGAMMVVTFVLLIDGI